VPLRAVLGDVLESPFEEALAWTSWRPLADMVYCDATDHTKARGGRMTGNRQPLGNNLVASIVARSEGGMMAVGVPSQH
jgi:hypothetical protein